MTETRDLNIILVDDNLDHIKIIIWALEQAEVRNKITIINDGEQAIKCLAAFHDGDCKLKRLPDLILLDINLPKVSGFDVLRYIKTNDGLQALPVIVLSSSDRGEDVEKAYALGANTFISKASVFNEVARSMNTLCSYWATVAQLPPHK
jgi:CheY-like chemotaxis protein